MTEFKDYKVADTNLADWGLKEVAIAETEMPGLMSLIEEYKDKNRWRAPVLQVACI